jgi:hypothetical protein
MKNNPSHKKILECAHSTFPDGSLKLISSKTTLITKPISDQLADPDASEDIIVTIEYKKKENCTTRHNTSHPTYVRGHPSVSLPPLSSPTLPLFICITSPHLCTIARDYS